MKLSVKTSLSSYDIIIGKGEIKSADKYLSLNRKVLIVTDNGVPEEYSKCISDKCKNPYIYTIPMGEASKDITNFEKILTYMLEKGFTRSDCVVAVGGGVVGDLAGFVASSFMRGVDFYNIPTTLLSQLDSSVGGKTAVDMAGVKNCVGAFYPPRAVIIDSNVLLTLDKRQFDSGLAEAVKMAATSDKALFDFFYENDYSTICNNIDNVIENALKIKIDVVTNDEKESGQRRILNFGHTVGHGIESASKTLTHGESVALGMLCMSEGEAREKIKCIIERIGLPIQIQCDKNEVISYLLHDKKKSGDTIYCVYVNEIGKGEIVKKNIDDFVCEVTKKL